MTFERSEAELNDVWTPIRDRIELVNYTSSPEIHRVDQERPGEESARVGIWHRDRTEQLDAQSRSRSGRDRADFPVTM